MSKFRVEFKKIVKEAVTEVIEENDFFSDHKNTQSDSKNTQVNKEKSENSNNYSGESVADMVDVLIEVKGVGQKVAKNVSQHFNSLSEIANSSTAELTNIDGVGSASAESILSQVRGLQSSNNYEKQPQTKSNESNDLPKQELGENANADIPSVDDGEDMEISPEPVDASQGVTVDENTEETENNESENNEEVKDNDDLDEIMQETGLDEDEMEAMQEFV